MKPHGQAISELGFTQRGGFGNGGVYGGGRSGSGNNGQRHMILIEELDQARVSPPGALRFEKFLSTGPSHLSKPTS